MCTIQYLSTLMYKIYNITVNYQFKKIQKMSQQFATLQRKLNQKRSQLRTLQQKYELNNVLIGLEQKKIKLLRKENEDMKSKSEKQSQIDTNLLLQSKQLSDTNTKLQQTIQQLQVKLLEPNADVQNVPDFVNIGGLTINGDSLEVDFTNKDIGDQEFMEIQPFKLESLILDNNKLTNASVSMLFTHMKSLKKLLLNSNNFDSSSLTNCSTMSNLKSLQLNSNQLGDSCMALICKIPHLNELSISKNKITDKGVQSLIDLSENLIYLDINNNMITDQGTKVIIKLKKLTHLYIGWNKLGYLGVRWLIKDLGGLEALDARLNQLSNQDKEKVRAQKGEKLQLFC